MKSRYAGKLVKAKGCVSVRAYVLVRVAERERKREGEGEGGGGGFLKGIFWV